MTLAQVIPLALNASLFMIVLALGLRTEVEEATYVLRRPGLLLRSVAAMNLVMPAFAVTAILMIPTEPALRVALVALSVSPVPPILPGKQQRAGGAASCAIGLLVATALLSVITVPGTIELIGRLFDRDVHVPFDRVLPIVLLSVIAPLALGIVLSSLLGHRAGRIAKLLSSVGTLLLVLALVPVLIVSWPLVRSLLGQGVVAVLILFTLVGLAVGHLLGGPDPGDRSVLALATATRHPGVAIAVAGLNFPNERAVSTVVLLHLLVGSVASAPYVRWRARSHTAVES